MTGGPPPFAVITGRQVQQTLRGDEVQITRVVEHTYRRHGAGDSVNPPSYFLRFPDRPSARIIALPASLGGPNAVDGMKWISSFPDNVAAGIPRAAAVLILNDHRTGYPIACMEGSIISASRTAASAALAADLLSRDRRRPRTVGFVGTGLIARYIHTFLTATGWVFDEIGIHDLSADHAAGFSDYLSCTDGGAPIRRHPSAESLIASSDLVIFATVATDPYVGPGPWFDHHPLVLHVSLRDLAPQVLLSAANIVDDVDHCLRADTSPHLVEQLTGNRAFLTGTLEQLITGSVSIPADQTVVFSPFGLGVLDLAVGGHIYRRLADAGELAVVDDFFHEQHRYR